MELGTIIEKLASNLKLKSDDNKKPRYTPKLKGRYGLFCEQYLEKPVISGDYESAMSPTACTIKNIPVIDDF